MRVGFGNGAEVLLHQGKRLGFLELAGDDQDDVVGLIVLAVEGLQVVDRHALDVGAVADGRFAVVVPLVGGGVDALHEDALRAVLAALELVADDRHFRDQVLALDEAVDEAVGFELDAELEVLVGGRHGLEVVGAIDVGGAVEAGAVVAQGLGHVGKRGRALEDHVLEQMGHAGLAVAFVARADQDGHVDGDRRPRRLGKKQHTGPVGQAVFGHAFDGGDFPRCILGARRRDAKEDEEQRG